MLNMVHQSGMIDFLKDGGDSQPGADIFSSSSSKNCPMEVEFGTMQQGIEVKTSTKFHKNQVTG